MIYSEICYRKILRDRVEALKSEGTDMSFQKLAEASSIPKSYVSKVINGVADFNGDQLHKVGRHLRFAEDEQDYLQLLLEHARSSLPERRVKLGRRIDEVRARKLDAREQMAARVVDAEADDGLTKYFLDPITQIVHMALMIPRYKRDVSKLAGDLGLSAARVGRSIDTLARLGFVKRGEKGLKVETTAMHLPRDAAMFETWRDQVRVLSLGRLRATDRDSSYAFSATFTATEATRLTIQAKFMRFLEALKDEVDLAPSEECYQLNFDLFSWTRA